MCTKENFDSYFRFSVSDDVLPREELAKLIASAADIAFVQKTFRAALSVVRKDGKTEAKLLLDELNVHAEEVADNDVAPLLAALFELGDELDVRSDDERGFSIGDNPLRIHWLLAASIHESSVFELV